MKCKAKVPLVCFLLLIATVRAGILLLNLYTLYFFTVPNGVNCDFVPCIIYIFLTFMLNCVLDTTVSLSVYIRCGLNIWQMSIILIKLLCD